MTITTRRTRPLGRASLVAATVSLLAIASACGTETDVNQAPASIGKAEAQAAASPWAEPAADASERLVNQAKARQGEDRHADTRRSEQVQPPESVEPAYLPPTGRPVPLPGQKD
jgi:hypothetical protein